MSNQVHSLIENGREKGEKKGTGYFLSLKRLVEETSDAASHKYRRPFKSFKPFNRYATFKTFVGIKNCAYSDVPLG
jgi:hypothetical protein